MGNLYRIKDGVYAASEPVAADVPNSLSPTLLPVLLYIFEEADQGGYDVVFTSALRVKDKGSTHASGRAVDVRIWHSGRKIPQGCVGDGPTRDESKYLVTQINYTFGSWEGNDGKEHKTAIIHGTGLNRHIHIQVPDRAWR